MSVCQCPLDGEGKSPKISASILIGASISIIGASLLKVVKFPRAQKMLGFDMFGVNP
jgi:ABC-type Fe3+-siderophore transport system permease subunit